MHVNDEKHLTFVYKTIKEKIAYRNSLETCPFCNREELEDIIEIDGPLILLKNKFPSLADTCQLVLVETENCSESILTYSNEHLRKLIKFGIDHWLEMEHSGDYKSVVFFKNHGPLSGGSMDHSHMQIVGMKNIDYKENIRDEIFEGIEIHKEGASLINISTKPNACSTEINIITRPRDDNYIADHLQILVNYIMKQSSSYNLFFYSWNNSIICKIVARWVTSPFIIGYSIPHDSNRIQKTAEDLRALF
ncbi:MAG: DUF4931 domain-containing protein [Spirochaetales bacterium]|uniref:DUF4931 domain-containing protein n=1 Tax=Candidatus Thalassospirochaeta sargassi TaxID=3119039 RepID=A0AAJ1IFP5_9SPIO|nr:DUF4931 domain-containing protein [Spirochaetales bacterium]